MAPTEVPTPKPIPTKPPAPRTITLYVDAESQGFTSANVRDRPSMEGAIVGSLAQGDRVKAYPATVEGPNGQRWYRIVYGQAGESYVLGTLLSRRPPTTSTEPEPEPEPTPSEPEPPAAGEVAILSDSSYDDAIDYTHVVGEVRNNTGEHVTYVRVTATFYNPRGKVVGTEFTFTALDVLAPRQTSAFDIAAELPAWDRYKLAVDYERADGPAPAGLKILSDSARTDDIGFYNIVGEVRNGSGRRLEYVKVVATLYDRRNRVIGVDFTFTSPENLRPGQVAPFELNFTEARLAGARYRLAVQGSLPLDASASTTKRALAPLAPRAMSAS